MVLRAVERDVEAVCDLFVRQPPADEIEDFALASGQGVQVAAAHREAIVARATRLRTTRKVCDPAMPGLSAFVGAGDCELPAVECLPGSLNIQPVRQRPVRERGDRYQNGAAEV